MRDAPTIEAGARRQPSLCRVRQPSGNGQPAPAAHLPLPYVRVAADWRREDDGRHHYDRGRHRGRLCGGLRRDSRRLRAPLAHRCCCRSPCKAAWSCKAALSRRLWHDKAWPECFTHSHKFTGDSQEIHRRFTRNSQEVHIRFTIGSPSVHGGSQVHTTSPQAAGGGCWPADPAPPKHKARSATSTHMRAPSGSIS